MKKTTKKLRLSANTIRHLSAVDLHNVNGGLSGDRCFTISDPCPASLTNSLCNACDQTDGCTAGCTGYPCQYP